MSHVAIFITDYAEPYIEKFGSFYDQSRAVLHSAGFEDDIKGYDIIKSQFPTDEEFQNIKAIWITGSRSDAFANDEWILKLRDYLQNVVLPSSVPVIGICFGHQIIGRALGAEVGRNEKGWELGVTNISINQDPEVQELFGDVRSKDFEILELHQDIVKNVPEGYKNIGSSKDTETQGLYKKGKVLSFQGHPEFIQDCAADTLDKIHNRGQVSDEYYENAKKRLEEVRHDGVDLTKVIIKFINESST
ncbi:hypothetical protein BN7_4838 [Wickerhamomyces ciferrii]|uniref:Glutamine amidotransferase domain-containing protein n=1 Tax=Wickerhamomyces ciferrii (strain ATCC 14091 / BCRC 22168 / CBS 111 / JCM 3599 / NBRC 0793 / NRRL Y-1031 F-60-10) TaxID=1206466 RepID=K0KQF3_WICCF|nr:uncharacterized protein BN7_4838 [Wickerhamomyces ciferrii]CCH45256.1 hypothetical protein BN7_4838 [Wickerhamomyces ciferrii]